MIQKVRNVKIIGTGSYLPEKVYTNEYLETLVETNAEWVYKNLGVKERRIAADDEFTSDLASKSSLKALEMACVDPLEIDLIIVATTTPDRLAPSTACIVQEKLGAFNAAAFDVAAVCSGFIYASTIAIQFISAGTYNNVLVVGSDIFSRITDWSRRDCVFFGDGSGAAIYSHADNDEGFISTNLFADGRGKFAWTVPAGGSEKRSTHQTIDSKEHYYVMDGKAVFNTAVDVLPKAINQVLEDSKFSIDDVKYIVPHQPSIGVLKETAKRLNTDFSKFLITMDKYANMSAGNIPVILDEALRAGKINKGDILLLAAVGSGWTWGASIMKWA